MSKKGRVLVVFQGCGGGDKLDEGVKRYIPFGTGL